MDESTITSWTLEYTTAFDFPNSTVDNQTNNDTIIEVFDLGPPLLIFTTIGIVIGTIFTVLCAIRYIREPELRTHYNYVFHFMLVYCFLSELISTPIFLIGYYENLFKDSIVLCQVSTLHYLTINIGMVTSLAYASVERHFLIFQKNGILTWARQIFPNTCLLIYSYIIAALFTLLPTCTYVPCIPCQATTVFYMIPWLTLSFFLPQCVMLVSTIYLLYRLRQQRSIVNRRVEWLVSRKIVVQMSLYVLWSCLYYCPVTFYNFIVLFDTSRYSPQLKSAMTIINTVGVQSYSILTFISMWLFTKRTKEQRKTQQRMKLNNLSSIILTMPKTNQRSSK